MRTAAFLLLGLCFVGDVAADCQRTPVFPEPIIATHKNTFSWATPMDVDFVIGALPNVADYALYGRASLLNATSLDTATQVPSPEAGFFYLVKSSDPCASWQTTPGAESDRDTEIHEPCSVTNPTDEQIETAVAASIEGLVDSWQDAFEFITLFDGIQDTLDCAVDLDPTPPPPSQTAEPLEQDCLLTQCLGVGYCGGTNTQDGWAMTHHAVDSCLNNACFEHDKCSFLNCVSYKPPCYFSPQSVGTGCDDALFAACANCPFDLYDSGARIICWIAKNLRDHVPSDPICNYPPCDNVDADCKEDACQPSDPNQDPNTGCVDQNTNEPGGSSCNDNLLCTTDESCAGGSCMSSCDDGNPCTDTACDDPDNPFICDSVFNTATCDDGNACTFLDYCFEGVCSGSTSAGSCDDGNACTVGDQCVGGDCSPGVLADCNDQDLCTTDSCNPATGCGNAPVGGPVTIPLNSGCLHIGDKQNWNCGYSQCSAAANGVSWQGGFEFAGDTTATNLIRYSGVELQFGNTLGINGVNYAMPNTSVNCNAAQSTIQVGPGVLINGTNTVSITGHAQGTNYDDFLVMNLRLEVSCSE